MGESPAKFSQQLTAAIRTIKAKSGKKIEIIQDELGFELGRNGGSYIAYLRKNNVPADLESLEMLVRLLIDHESLSAEQGHAMLSSGGHPEAAALIQHWFTEFEPDPTPKQPDHHTFQYQKRFIVGPPISHPSRFFGRRREAGRIFQFLSGLPFEHTAIIGPRRSGKTSLLHYIRTLPTTPPTELRPDQSDCPLPHPDQYRMLFVDFQDPRMRSLNSLLKHLLVGFGITPPDTVDLDQFMDLCEGALSERPTVIMLDELGAALMSPELDLSFWWALRSMINLSQSGGLAFLLAGHDDPVRLADQNDKTSPFFNIFNTIQLGPLTESEARELINSAPVPIEESAVAWMLAESGRWPCLLQILCREYVDAHQFGDEGDQWRTAALAQFKNYPDLLPAA